MFHKYPKSHLSTFVADVTVPKQNDLVICQNAADALTELSPTAFFMGMMAPV